MRLTTVPLTATGCSNAPMSQRPPDGRRVPRWSTVEQAAAVWIGAAGGVAGVDRRAAAGERDGLGRAAVGGERPDAGRRDSARRRLPPKPQLSSSERLKPLDVTVPSQPRMLSAKSVLCTVAPPEPASMPAPRLWAMVQLEDWIGPSSLLMPAPPLSATVELTQNTAPASLSTPAPALPLTCERTSVRRPSSIVDSGAATVDHGRVEQGDLAVRHRDGRVAAGDRQSGDRHRVVELERRLAAAAHRQRLGTRALEIEAVDRRAVPPARSCRARSCRRRSCRPCWRRPPLRAASPRPRCRCCGPRAWRREPAARRRGAGTWRGRSGSSSTIHTARPAEPPHRPRP